MLINSLDEAHKAVTASESLNLYMTKLDQVKVEELPPTPQQKSPAPGCVNQGPRRSVTPPLL